MLLLKSVPVFLQKRACQGKNVLNGVLELPQKHSYNPTKMIGLLKLNILSKNKQGRKNRRNCYFLFFFTAIIAMTNTAIKATADATKIDKGSLDVLSISIMGTAGTLNSKGASSGKMSLFPSTIK